MSTPVGIAKAPKRRLARLADLNPTRALSKSPGSPSPKAQPQPKKIKNKCPNQTCEYYGKEAEVVEDSGQVLCSGCGTVLDSSNIVSDVTFGETSTGQAVVQGSHIGENQRIAHTLGAGAPRGIGGSSNSREQALRAGGREIDRLISLLPLGSLLRVATRAKTLYGVASASGFTQGRNTRAVAGVCLYYCCRTDGRGPADHPLMLMDIAERINYNVFRLGDIYKDFQKKLFLRTDQMVEVGPGFVADGANNHTPYGFDVEALVRRFCRRLDFQGATGKVAEDACKLLRRMDRDWMVTGRRPAGLCGACIILAARMNNFRRTVREVVFVVRVTDSTLVKRLDEFRHTTASRMTVNQFRDVGEFHRYEHDPPVLRDTQLKAEKREAKRRLRDIEGIPRSSVDPSVSRQTTAAPEAGSSRSVEPRRDAEGFVIPALPGVPIDPSLMGSLATATPSVEAAATPDPTAAGGQGTKKRGRKRKHEAVAPPIELTQGDLAFERAITKEIEKILHTRIELEEFSFNLARDRALAQANAERLKERKAMLSTGRPDSLKSGEVDYDSEFIDPSEFADDPEVLNCELSELERKVKEKIWLQHNEDWLRAQQKKMLDATLEEARNGGKKPKKTPSKRGRIGDGSFNDGRPKASTPAEAVQRMVEKRLPKFSKHVNYDRIMEIYTTNPASGGSSRTGTPGPSLSTASPPAVAGASPSPLTPGSTQSGQVETIDISSDEGEDDDGPDDEDFEAELEQTKATTDTEMRKALGNLAGPAAAIGFGDPRADKVDVQELGQDDFEGYNDEEEEEQYYEDDGRGFYEETID